MKENRGNVVVWILIVGAIAAFFIFGGGNDNSNYDYRNSNQFRSSYGENERTIDRYDAIYDYWDEIKDYVDGTETIEACSWEAGNCYDLDADISSGVIETIYFINGGYLYLSADIDEDGNASDIDYDGNSWDFNVDINSSIIDDAVNSWAEDNDYNIE